MTVTAPAAPLRTDEFTACWATIAGNVARVIRGKDEVIGMALTCLIARGHLLVEDVPGVGKTSLARALSTSLGTGHGRIQFTPDLLPSDVTGVSIFNQRNGEFEFRPGPVFHGIVLADEINRASPKTQSALLEVMEERQVTVDGVTYEVPSPFMVIATQNPIDMHGTYPLPEAQLDRFTMRISIGYPDPDSEADVLRSESEAPVDTLTPVADARDLAAMIETARTVYVSDALYRYIVAVVTASRGLPEILLGASPRAGVALLRTARARAVAFGRDHVRPEDVKVLAAAVLAHRLRLRPEAQGGPATPHTLVARVLATVPVPAGS
jgi:MoxR-like ATPase